ncbi:hypothetical protein J4H86_20345 [Spiractinospora alimapuensis]|uniref:hypothetical protein n=1 Tax=Spiractinospora alimapuensis TaxID=2820884 RepID=UPI001F4084F1|nr:hypothetical protein [Spiractinospora alimapuensis]QVQ51155.1 hypothetical protein J4H86_20345 [Spiractinospora alimapuensis]
MVEYLGHYRFPEHDTVTIPMIAVIEYDGDRVHHIREYWDTHQLATASAPE